VASEAGPTGFGLYRQQKAAEIRCEVAAPSKLQMPAGERVKTDAKDAIHLARPLRLDEVHLGRHPHHRSGSGTRPGACPGGLSRGLMRPATASQSCLATPITFPTALVWLLEAAEDLLRDTPQRTSGIHNEVADHADMTDPTVLEPRPGDSPAY
jgi:hypothetical protein